MDIKKDEMTEITANEISTGNISGTQESGSDIEVMTETTEDAVKYVSAATANGTGTASDAASAPDVDNPSRNDTTETTSTSAEADPAVTDSTEANPAAAATDPAETNLTAAAPMAIDLAETDSTEEEPATPKNEGKKRRLWGILELTAAALIFVFSVYLFLNTRGTNLLFVSVTFGRICRYYWIGLLAAMILGLVGGFTLKRHPHAVAKTDTKEDK